MLSIEPVLDEAIYAEVKNSLDKYDYPEEVFKAATEFCQIVRSAYSGMKVGILLVGSTSRGELAFKVSGEGLTLFSDMEFLVSVEKSLKASNRYIDQLLKTSEGRLNFGELFHFDYTIIPTNKLKNVEKKFFTFEAASAGIELGDWSVASQLPAVDIDNINVKELNEVLTHRLDSIVQHYPTADRTVFSGLNYDYKLCLAKNCLDITTWLTPLLCGKLEVGFAKRLNLLWQHSIIDSALTLPDEDLNFLNECLLARKSEFYWINDEALLQRVYELFCSSIDVCYQYYRIKNGDLSESKTSRLLFDEYAPKKRLRIILSGFRSARAVGLLGAINNAILPIKGIRAAICLTIFQYILFARAQNPAGMKEAELRLMDLFKHRLTALEFKPGGNDIAHLISHYKTFNAIYF